MNDRDWIGGSYREEAGADNRGVSDRDRAESMVIGGRKYVDDSERGTYERAVSGIP